MRPRAGVLFLLLGACRAPERAPEPLGPSDGAGGGPGPAIPVDGAPARSVPPAGVEPPSEPLAQSAFVKPEPTAAAVTSVLAPVDPLFITVPREPVTRSFDDRPFTFTAAFDGSLRFSLWHRTLRFARGMKAKYERGPSFTYFVNAAFFSTSPGKSDVGKAMSRAEVLVRRALAQQAINEGHEIADHGAGHLDGRTFDREQWLTEIDRSRRLLVDAFFEPIPREGGGFVFPVFAPTTEEPGRLGARCETDEDCGSKVCLHPTPEQGLCSEACNLKTKCPEGFACGAPMFRTDTDLCLPVPRFPVKLDDLVLFDERGEPNLAHPRLARYSLVGFRAPYLGANDALYEALMERGFLYDTSQSVSPGPPFHFVDASRGRRLLELGLAVHSGVLTIPMDYNYARLEASPERMLADYLLGIDQSLSRGRVPFNVGHHFTLWHEGAYLSVLEQAVEHVLSGCPKEGEARCPGAEVATFRELAGQLSR
jgi:peptidoglycan/xylan/chitin deacetylase (PgdA/CDA1 family)